MLILVNIIIIVVVVGICLYVLQGTAFALEALRLTGTIPSSVGSLTRMKSAFAIDQMPLTGTVITTSKPLLQLDSIYFIVVHVTTSSISFAQLFLVGAFRQARCRRH